jgi:nucleoside-diphosphate-sugar epimerase
VRILLLGGTGLIGSAVLSELSRRGHSVLALARSAASAQKATTFDAAVIGGDIETPEAWVPGLHAVDAVVHAACDFASPMGEVDRHLLDVLLAHLGSQPKRARFIYTGGNWLFGATGDVVATEQSDFAPLAAFAWMVPHSRRILDSVEVEGIVIHPAMVYDGGDGVFRRFARDAIERTAVRVVGAESVRWPLVHRSDLATLYALALERASAGSSYIGAAVEGLPVGRIARAFARRYGSGRLEPEIISADAIAAECGEWARGYALDQQLSGAKARRELGWRPSHLDPEREIASLPA